MAKAEYQLKDAKFQGTLKLKNTVKTEKAVMTHSERQCTSLRIKYNFIELLPYENNGC